MKPAFLAPDDLRDALFVGHPLIDVRAPVEFAAGTLPGAINLPLLDDEQRAAVGVLYKQKGSIAAIELGKLLVSGTDLERKMESWLGFARAHPNALIFCFRGGLRSQSVRDALASAGAPLPALEGGFKRARRALIDALEAVVRSERFVAVSGCTGSAKTRLIRDLSASRKSRAIDLEGLAHHKGSAFGALPEPQPSQVNFENTLAIDLWRQNESAISGPIVLEDESRLIGRAELPLPLYKRLMEAPLYVIETPRAERAEFLARSYVQDGLPSVEAFRLFVRSAIAAISKRLGGAESSALLAMANTACDEHERSGDVTAHVPWTMRLLERYYDPLYLKHLHAASERIAMRGSYADVQEAVHRLV